MIPLKKLILTILLLVLACSACAAADGFPPEDAVLLEQTADGGCVIERLQVGDAVLIVTSENDRMLSMRSETIPEFVAAPQSSENVRGILTDCIPNAVPVQIVAAKALPEGGFSLAVCWFLTDDASGALYIADDVIIACDLTFGAYRANGLLTEDGARRVLGIFRPDAVVTELELEKDDGLLIYEGEALVNGIEYEFEIDAITPRLLEWERD